MFGADDALARADWPFLKDGPVTLFWRPALFDAAKADLRALGYLLPEITCRSEEQFILALSEALGWKALFGYEPWTGNLNALDDAFWSWGFGEARDVALCLGDFHVLAREGRGEFAGCLLDIIARAHRRYLLRGRRLLALVQTNDATYSCDGLGATDAHWNDREWLNVRRGPQ
ncbi:hypothetical protein [Phenylobacterium sp.]|uniref:hypothetical protein n=1 Tax=Phenylobacterium sp. TaxID=1871053 RepID=UPI00301CBF73